MRGEAGADLAQMATVVSMMNYSCWLDLSSSSRWICWTTYRSSFFDFANGTKQDFGLSFVLLVKMMNFCFPSEAASTSA